MFSSAVTGLGQHNSKTACDQWDPEFTQGQFVQENAFKSRGLVRRIVRQEPRDAMRKGWGVSGLSPESSATLKSFNLRRTFDAKFQTLREWARKSGGAAMFMDIDDGQTRPDGTQDWAAPVRFDTIKRLGALTVIDRWDLEVRDFQHDLEHGEMFAPTAYHLVQLQNRVIHPSRLLVMQGITLTPREHMEHGGWGQSVIDAVWKSLHDYMTAHSYMAEALIRNTQGVLTMPTLEGPMSGCDSEQVEQRMQMLSFWMSAIGDIALTGDEKYEVVQRGMTGMADVGRAFFEQLVVDTEIPMTILGGQTPGGLNSGANAGEWQSWTSHLGGEQVRTYNPLIRQYLEVVFRAGNFAIPDTPDDWDIEWPELFEPNIVEFSTAVQAIANAGVLLAQAQMYSDSEIRNSPILKKAFPHEEGTTVETEIPETVGEPEEEDLSVAEETDEAAAE